MVKLHILNFHELIPYKEEALGKISGERLYKALKYVKEEDTLRSICGSLLMKKHTNGLDDIKYDFYGKPYKDNIYFSLSHSNDYVLLGIADTEIGVDIELNRSRNSKLQDYVLSNVERSYLKEEMDFYKMWTSKESLVKYVGFGIDRDLKQIPALPLNGYKEYLGKKAFAYSTVYKNDYAISVTIEKEDKFEIIEEKIESLLE